MSVAEVAKGGPSIWLDDLSRAKISGTDAHSLPSRIAKSGVVGVTTNPSIFGAAIAGADEYAADIAAMKNASVDDVVKKLTTDDVRAACDLFKEIYSATKGVDGRVSIEVDPRLAHDTEATIAQGKEHWSIIDRPNLMIKVPATIEGLPAITALIAAGISVNVTLIFSVKRYGAVIDATSQELKLQHTQHMFTQLHPFSLAESIHLLTHYSKKMAQRLQRPCLEKQRLLMPILPINSLKRSSPPLDGKYKLQEVLISSVHSGHQLA